MPNTKKKQSWLIETDKTALKTLQDKVTIIKEIFLLDIDKVIDSKVNNSSVNDKHIDLTPVLGTINNVNSQVDLKKTDLKTLEKKITKDLESKKRNVVTNFIISFLTFGKINRNQDIKTELNNIKVTCKDIENECENITKDLEVKTNRLWDIMQTKNSSLATENQQLVQANKELEKLVANNKIKIEELKINMAKNAIQIEELEKANEEKIDFIGNKNIKFDSQCLTLEKIIESQKEEIKLHKENIKVLEAELKLRDSGIESAIEAIDSDAESTFNQDEVNMQHQQTCNKKTIKSRVVQIN